MWFCETQGQEYKHASERDWNQEIQALGTGKHSLTFTPLCFFLYALLGFSALCYQGLNQRLDILRKRAQMDNGIPQSQLVFTRKGLLIGRGVHQGPTIHGHWELITGILCI